ncbi:glycerol-3-phosphate dehydrogenase/oxidase [Rubritalea tangerina]|uniref:FAD-dependent oxidoreductase n=1 Tax=Rubritalea tangerina TaxID=430798 RepID=A0ABW4ZDG6_9BACT
MLPDPRISLIAQAQNEKLWDIIVIGGGATGLATAWDAASRGYKVALLEANDFANATSSRSTKLIHGGVRYLQKGEIGLVREALEERHLLLNNAAAFARPQRFILPTHSPLAKYYYRFGMWLYDTLAGHQNIHPAQLLSQKALHEALPQYSKPSPTGGVAYSDAQFDDAALAVAFAQCINASGNLAVNYLSVDSLLTQNHKVHGVHVRDTETQQTWKMRSKLVINATGIFSDDFRQSTASSIHWKIQTSRGSHIVVPGNALGSTNALIIPKTTDGRVLFAIPWKAHTLIGTTDVATEAPELHPIPSEQEIAFLVNEAQCAFQLDPSTITSSWAGLRPLVSRAQKSSTAALSRKHIIDISSNGLISILGGKWTTCRKMAEDTIDAAIKSHSLSPKACQTKQRVLTDHGALPPLHKVDDPPIDPTPHIHEFFHQFYARTPDDILARRTRHAMLDSQTTKALTPSIAATLESLKSGT